MEVKMSLLEDFKAKYGEELTSKVISRAGIHSNLGSEPPTGNVERLIFGLLEIIDFQCNTYGDFEGISDEEIKRFLVEHKEEVGKLHIKPPSYLGLLAGAFDFMV